MDLYRRLIRQQHRIVDKRTVPRRQAGRMQALCFVQEQHVVILIIHRILLRHRQKMRYKSSHRVHLLQDHFEVGAWLLHLDQRLDMIIDTRQVLYQRRAELVRDVVGSQVD